MALLAPSSLVQLTVASVWGLVPYATRTWRGDDVKFPFHVTLLEVAM